MCFQPDVIHEYSLTYHPCTPPAHLRTYHVSCLTGHVNGHRGGVPYLSTLFILRGARPVRPPYPGYEIGGGGGVQVFRNFLAKSRKYGVPAAGELDAEYLSRAGHMDGHRGVRGRNAVLLDMLFMSVLASWY